MNIYIHGKPDNFNDKLYGHKMTSFI